MTRIFQLCVIACGLVGSAGTADACCLWPFGGWWGAGYAPMASYGYGGYGGYQSVGYQPMAYQSAGYYPSASYGCCATNCCDPCGSCSSGSCGASTGTSPGTSDSLKPTTDPNFDKGTNDYDRDDSLLEQERRDLERRRRLRDMDNSLDTPPGRGNSTSPADDFAPMGSSFDEDPQLKNKPPMDDVDGLLPTDPTTPDSDFLPPPDSGTDKSTQLNRGNRLAHQSSRMSEVLAPKRLASRSLPSKSKTTMFAGNAGSDQQAPVRWISAPAPDGQVRL
jgi:hypothetical protein